MDGYNEIIEPTRVSNCLGCNFISSQQKHLIVGKANYLQIFEVINSKQIKLKLVSQFRLHGLITDLKSIRTSENPNLDYLVVSTKFAKFSIIKWDHHHNTIVTVSLHYYEKSIETTTYEKLSRSEIIVEPTYYSCILMRFKNILAILPLEGLQDDDEDDDDVDVDIDVDDGDDIATNNQNGNGNNNSINNNTSDKINNIITSNNKVNNNDDDDTNLVDNDVKRRKNTNKANFFDQSYILHGSSLDPSIGTIVDMKFLYNYQEPTLAIVSQNSYAWAGTLPKVKDNIQFIVLTFDLITKTSIPVFKVDNLPYDIDRIFPLNSPLNGCILLGCNEIIHVDNGGITRRIAINKYTTNITASTKAYVDQTNLNLKLEGCSLTQIPNDHRVLLSLIDGTFYFIYFEVDGKSIKKVSIDPINENLIKDITINYPGEVATLDNNLLFLANRNGNSQLVQYKYQEEPKMKKQIQNIQEEDDNDDFDPDDDLYDDEEDKQQNIINKSNLELIKHDELVNNGPVSTFTLGFYSTERIKSKLINPNYKEISIFANAGTHGSTKLNIITPTIQPIISSSLSFSEINRMWTINKKFLITSDDINSKSEIFQIEKSYARLNSKDFINNESTIGMHELNNGKYILQITPKLIVLYTNSFKKKLNITEEIKDDEIINSYLRDEFLMVFLSSGEVLILSINTYNQTYSKLDIPKILSDTIITTGYITNSFLLNAVLKDVNLLINSRGNKRRHSDKSGTAIPEAKNLGPKLKTFILVTGDNRVVAFNRFHNQRCYQLNDVDKFTENLTLGFFEPKQIYPDPFIKQVILNEIGDAYHKEEYLTILTIGGEVIMYKLFFDGENYKFVKEKDIPITGAPDNAYPTGTAIERRLVYFSDLNGYTSIFVTGVIPYLILKSVHSIPRIYKFTKIAALSAAPYNDHNIKNGLVFLDNKKNARICELPLDFEYENTWPMKKVHIGELMKSITYHEKTNTFVISTCNEVPYNAIDEDGNSIVGVDKDKPSALAFSGSIKLISPFNWSVIDTIELTDNEIGMNVKSMKLDVGTTNKKLKNNKEFIVIGTGKYRMEDLVSLGSFKIYEVIDIIPEPGRPETNHKFKEVFQEDSRGAVTAITEVSGRLLATQGQKVIVRDIKDDGVVPVAFYDTAVYVSEAKSFGNLILLGDSLKSVWLIGFDAEPFRMIMLGKDLQSVDVNCADFIVKDEEIYILIADNNGILHLVKYDPEDPESLQGQRLLNKASFSTNSYITSLKSIPTIEESFNYELRELEKRISNNFQSIGSTTDGSFFSVFPVQENTYRRMYILQQQLIDKEYHYCGLNPRLNRFGNLSLSYNDTNIKPILDYEVIRSFLKLNDDRKRNLASKVGNYQDIWKDLIEFEHVSNNI